MGTGGTAATGSGTGTGTGTGSGAGGATGNGGAAGGTLAGGGRDGGSAGTGASSVPGLNDALEGGGCACHVPGKRKTLPHEAFGLLLLGVLFARRRRS
jgi:MYXO-CTERM domain-containing protein